MEWLVVAGWLGTLFVLAAIGAPLAAWLFPTLPRRGAAFALPTTLLAVALFTFWIGQVTYGEGTVLAAVLLTGLGSAVVLRRGARPNWRAVATGFGVFAVGFSILVVFRAADPTIIAAGGEHFLHFALTKALSRATALPPEDFWFAGEPLRYYYGTQLQLTSLSTLTGTPIRLGYNLGLATFYGVLVVSAYGLVGAVVDAAGYSRRVGGVIGAFFVAIGGASTTAIRLLVARLPDGLATTVGEPAFGFAAGRYDIPLARFIADQGSPAGWSWWYTRYVVPGTLQEFPFYAFIKGDLHGHTLSTGYVVVAAALAYSYYRLPAERRRRRLAVLVGGLGVVAGVFGFMNTWSLPTAVGLAWLAVAAADAHPGTLLPDALASRVPRPEATGAGWAARLRGEVWRLVLAVIPAALVGLVGVVLASPFLVFGHVPENQGIGLFPPRSPLAPFLVIYGAILLLVATFLSYRSWPIARQYEDRLVVGAGLLGLLGALVVAVPLAFPVLAVVGPLLLGAWWLVRTGRVGFAGVLVVGGLGLLLSFELAFAKVAPWPEGPPRWNTAYKISIQAWLLLALGAAAMATALLANARSALAARVATASSGSSESSAGRRSAILAGLVVVAVIVASSPFAVLATATEVGDHVAHGSDFHLDGLENHERVRPDEMAAINWLDDRDGTPTIVEAPGRSQYSWSSPASSLTGIPTVVGWLLHESNYRGDELVAERTAAVDAVYRGPWANATRTLRSYDVRYVYVGPIERERYGTLQGRFEGRRGLSVAFENDAVTIYRVDQDGLAAG